ncbi:MAG: pyridoxamine 5'-phosphate oxidase family protein [Defluviitaleaceae bacterium]|nr:pyridoxamine 5'-phosphate oxidase family protein [Defluviitaleaceae bacterium]
MNKQILEKANAIIAKCDSASFGVIDESGYPSASAVSLCYPQDVLEVYFTTSLDCNKTNRIRANSKASINFFTDSDNITLVGVAEILTDQESKSKYWQSWFSQIYGDETNPDYCVIKFTTQRVSFWIGNEGAEFDIK